jgi:hypothetical protein
MGSTVKLICDSPIVMLISLSLPASYPYFEVLIEGRHPRREALMKSVLMINSRRRSMPVWRCEVFQREGLAEVMAPHH